MPYRAARSLSPVVFVALVGALATPPAEALCKQPALISTIDLDGNYSYLHTPGVVPAPGGSSMTAATTGAFWALGFGDPALGAGFDNGAFPALDGDLGGWLYLPPGYPAWFLTSWAADTRIDACIDDATSDPDCTAVLLADDAGGGPTYFTLLTAAETLTRDYFFNQPGNAPIVLAPIPPPVVAGFDGTTATIAAPILPPDGFHLDPACFANTPAGVVAGYKVYWFRQVPGGPVPDERAPATDPTALSGWWPARGGTGPDGAPLPLAADAAIDLGCQPWDVRFALRLVFDSGFATTYVSDVGALFPACDCSGSDADGDGYCVGSGGTWEDCDDSDPAIFPGAGAPCDGRNNDCLDPIWPALGDDELDGDGDGFARCDDCDDTEPTVFPDAPEVCDGQVNRCGGTLPNEERDPDGDGWLECEGDCAPTTSTVYPGAPEVCDNRNNDCNHPNWPLNAGSETSDDDGDGISECDGDCWDFLEYGDGVPGGTIYPGAPEACDGVANDCLVPNWPAPPVGDDDFDADGDGSPDCADCADGDAATYSGAPEICDGTANDCDAPGWPEPIEEHADADGDGWTICEGDCTDVFPTIYPAAPQLCDGINNDCNDPTWPDVPEDEGYSDEDSARDCADCAPFDRFVYPGAPTLCDGKNNDCNDPNWPALPPDELDADGDEFAACAECDDTNPGVYPGAPQLCDGVNNNCNSPSWPELPSNETDFDLDGFSACEGDCRTSDATVYPGAPQLCDGRNNDCSDPSWPALPPDEVDHDGDGRRECADCDDADAAVYPGAAQLCDGVNNNCNDPNWPAVPPVELDLDADGFLACVECDDADPATYPEAPQICDGVNNDCVHPFWPALDGTNENDSDGDGFSECTGDCAPLRRLVYPGAPEFCDGMNNDCNHPDWPEPLPGDIDADADDFPACSDCDDTDSSVFPGAQQRCDGVNTNCDDPLWPEVPEAELDHDSDGFIACADCDDADATVYPGALELCDEQSNNCNDPNWPAPHDEDADGDGDGLSTCGGDCDDDNVDTYPGAPEVCDGDHNDCADPNWPTPPEGEGDADGDLAPECGDCNDLDPAVHPGAPQVCDGVNNDCADPGYPGLAGTNEFDDDGDSYTECAGDCADANPARNPGADEDCDNGIDDDCDGLTDYFDAFDCRDLFVELESFTATAEAGGVRLRWSTSQELDSAGFRVLRSNGNRRLETLTSRPIPSRGDALRGAEYEFVDTDRQSTGDLRYWLEEIDLRGKTTRFGPVTVERAKR